MELGAFARKRKLSGAGGRLEKNGSFGGKDYRHQTGTGGIV